MFDADTVALIAGASPLDGLDLAALPLRLTNAYASIVAARVRVRDIAGDAAWLPAETVRIVAEMRRLAFTHEAFVSALPERPDRAAAAFVSGAAHHICLLAERVKDTHRPTHLGVQGISPEVSAVLLFLIAEASADAAEMAKSISIAGNDQVEARLLSALQHLAHGRLRDLLNDSLPESGEVLDGERPRQAVRALYYLTLLGVRELAARLSGLASSGDARVDISDPIDVFERVKGLCIAMLAPVEGLDPAPASVYPGPFHLASLLVLASRDLLDSALVKLGPPEGVAADPWRATMERMARRRPYLWRNHRKAIEAGYLAPGISAAISFPTGAGKSTVAELKIAATLLRGARVVFLAPTLALVEQTANTLRRTFPAVRVEREQEAQLFEEGEELPDIAVMTPERCLTLLSFDREVFVDVGLFIFDECHLLHPPNPEHNRRAIDAMLCVLNFTAVAPAADLLLLSAMMSNAEEIAAWLAELTGRECLPLSLTWKPTRQVRGCVVYEAAEIQALETRLTEAARQRKTKNPPAALKRELAALPYGFFCLRQTWVTNERDDYTLLRLLTERVTLATGTGYNGNWYLTPNGNQVATALAAATSRAGLKTLIFTQTVPFANAIVENLNEELGDAQRRLTVEELHLYEIASEETGGPHRLYLDVSPDGILHSSSACHHGLLLPSERSLHESLFRRHNGIDVLVATSTLAQGMNLPSEIVILQGDSRFDPDANRMERLEAHELLNAAGRAGRAGESSFGLVLVVPSKVVHFDDTANRIHQHWGELRAIFAQSDQCVQIDDPFTALLDQIHLAAASEDARYLLRRLPLGAADQEGGDDAPTRLLLNRSLAAFRARLRGDQAWVDARIEAAVAARHADPDAPAVLTWADRLAASAGIPVAIVRELGDRLLANPLGLEAGTSDWRNWVFEWLVERPALIPALIRRESLEGLFGTPYKQLADDEARGGHVIGPLLVLLEGWMAGETLEDLERAYGIAERDIRKCATAREFVLRVLRVLPELAYVLGLASAVARNVGLEREGWELPTVALETLGSCAREGIDRPEKLALRIIRKKHSRIATHREFDELGAYLEPPAEHETFNHLVERVGRAAQRMDREKAQE
jgi:superfamily II DNA/RNA helicase